jgi:hypothetical protein
MRRLALVLMLAVSLTTVCPARERTSHIAGDEIKTEAERAFGEILELWHTGKYDELYEKTRSGGTQTRQSFIGKLSAVPFRPACCWQQMQDVTVTVKNEKNVVIRAKIGMEGLGDTHYRTGSFKLRKENGVWRVSRSELLSLAGASKRKGQRFKKTRI